MASSDVPDMQAAEEGPQPCREAPQASDHDQGKKPRVCRFYQTKNGCRAGNACRFLHSAEDTAQAEATPTASPAAEASTAQPRPRPAAAPRASRDVVARPVPKSQVDSPREFQMTQIMRRFKPELSESDSSSTLKFAMKPSDPDFPYEIEALRCTMTVPKSYPNGGRPQLQVTNTEIPRGFQINIERGFEDIASSNPNATLLGLMNRLDRQLEAILAGRMAETIKIVANRSQPHSRPSPAPAPQPVAREASKDPGEFTDEQRAFATTKRQSHTRQLEARFGRVTGFVKSADGLSYTVPLDSPKKHTWPNSFQNQTSFKLHVPLLYPIQVATIDLGPETAEAGRVEDAFVALQSSLKDFTLTQLINHLLQHVPDMAKEVASATHAQAAERRPAVRPADDLPQNDQLDESHIQVIPRPPEWSTAGRDADRTDGSDDGNTSDAGTADDSGTDTTHEEDVAEEPSSSVTTQERGILLSFPHIEMHGIELMELISLGLTIKCERCKAIMDVERLRDYSGKPSDMRQQACKKCATTMSIGFRSDLMHINSARAGYLDLEGCSVADMLPSNFVPTCSNCSTQYSAPGVVSVRGDSAFAICRECHGKMTFRIAEVKFLQVSAAAIRSSTEIGPRKVKENLGITAGTELPRRGRCSHYAKSYRWFRFSCCSKVFPCDRCHDDDTDHPNEHANRMICGFCSREQNFRPENCQICHAVLVGKRGRGFWEGGKGTRDPARMSRKDPRKYKRRPGTKPKD